MARLYTYGAELRSITAGVETTSGGGGGQITIETTTVRSGSAAIRIAPVAANRFVGQVFSGSLIGTKIWAKIAFYVVSAPIATNFADIIAPFGSGAGAQKGRIRLNADMTLSLVDQASNVIGSSSALNTGQWYEAELFIEQAATTMTAKVDGVQFATSTTATMATYDAIYWGSPQTISTFDIIWDDFAINDSSGSFQNSWVGSEKVLMLVPNVAGDSNQWLKTGGGAGTSTNYQEVDETTPDDVTTHVNSATLNDIDMYNMSDSGIGSSDTVNVVHVGARFRNSTADATTAFAVRIEKTSGGTVSEATAITPNSATWKTNNTTTARSYPLTTYQDPDSSNWTQSTLDSMQTGVKLTLLGVNAIQVTKVWAMLGYTPSTATITTTPTPTLLTLGVG